MRLFPTLGSLTTASGRTSLLIPPFGGAALSQPVVVITNDWFSGSDAGVYGLLITGPVSASDLFAFNGFGVSSANHAVVRPQRLGLPAAGCGGTNVSSHLHSNQS